MAHMVETMAYAGETPWHKLGVPVANNLTPEEIRIAAGINWGLTKAPLYTPGPDGQLIMVKNRFSLMRDSDGEVYDIVSDLYKPVQPERAFSFFKRFTEAGHMDMETAGSLQNGKRIWALAKIGEGFTLKGGDRMEGYLLLCSPNECGKSFQIKFTLIRVVCHNTLTAAVRGESGFWMSHLNEFNQNMQEHALEVLGIAHEKLAEQRATAEKLSQTKAAREQVLEYVARLVQPNLLGDVVQATTAYQDAEAAGSVLDAIVAESSIPTPKTIDANDFNKVGRTILDAIIDSPGAELPSARGTWFGALNGVTYAVDHKLGTDKNRLSSAWFGDKENLKNRAVNLAVEYANQN